MIDTTGGNLMARAANMQALTDDVKRKWSGATVYGIGDAAHKTRASDHNEDDLSGSKAAQSDPDGRSEHRAIDIMVRGPFTKSDGDALVAYLLKHHKDRLYGIIWHGSQWWRSSGWVRQARTTDPHDDHVHISGYAADDENTATWLGEVDDMDTTEREWLRKTTESVLWLRDYVYKGLNGEDKATGGENIELAGWIREAQAERATMLANLAELRGKDWTNEPQIIAGVLQGLTPEMFAQALKLANVTPEAFAASLPEAFAHDLIVALGRQLTGSAQPE